jgi:hypothetical protein
MIDPYEDAKTQAIAAFGTAGDAREAERLITALDAYRLALTAAGLLAAAEAPEAEELARFLARESRHPRYSGDGWKTLCAAPGDIELAYGHALAHLGPGDEGPARDLAYARRELLVIADRAAVS